MRRLKEKNGQSSLSEHKKESRGSHFRGKVKFKVKTLNEKKRGSFVVIRSIKKMWWSPLIPAVTVKNEENREDNCRVRTGHINGREQKGQK